MSTFDKVKEVVIDKLGVEEEKIVSAASFEIEIPDEDAETITTVQAAVDYIESNK